MPLEASSTRVVERSLSASVEPSEVTALPGVDTPAARNAAMESVVPPGAATTTNDLPGVLTYRRARQGWNEMRPD
jgi:hypothetical protein